jgi:hypothetical protein
MSPSIFDALVKSRILDGKKRFKIKASQIPRNAAQRRYWTFCEAIIFGPGFFIVP